MASAASLPTVLLLGVPHLANRNRDVFNVQFDDMLGPRRQREIGECAERLARFRPTKMALEVVTDRDDALNEDYRGYRAGAGALTADEVHQFGFRIAADLGHERVYAINWNEGTGDLGRVYERLQGRKNLSAWLSAPATPTMQATFAAHPLDGEEIHALAAFFEASAKQGGEDDMSGPLAFFLMGTGGAALALVAMDAVWRGRFRSVRRVLVRGKSE